MFGTESVVKALETCCPPVSGRFAFPRRHFAQQSLDLCWFLPRCHNRAYIPDQCLTPGVGSAFGCYCFLKQAGRICRIRTERCYLKPLVVQIMEQDSVPRFL